MVPRGGIEPSPIQLKIHHFLNGDLPVYLPVDPALSSRPGECDSVQPYPSGAHGHALYKNAVRKYKISRVVMVQSSPKAKAPCSNRVGRAILRFCAISPSTTPRCLDEDVRRNQTALLAEEHDSRRDIAR
jgi:hypothetical protein